MTLFCSVPPKILGYHTACNHFFLDPSPRIMGVNDVLYITAMGASLNYGSIPVLGQEQSDLDVVAAPDDAMNSASQSQFRLSSSNLLPGGQDDVRFGQPHCSRKCYRSSINPRLTGYLVRLGRRHAQTRVVMTSIMTKGARRRSLSE